MDQTTRGTADFEKFLDNIELNLETSLQHGS